MTVFYYLSVEPGVTPKSAEKPMGVYTVNPLQIGDFRNRKESVYTNGKYEDNDEND